MRIHTLAALAMIAIGASSCTTTEQASSAVQSRWIGRPADDFFTQHGPPQSDYTLANGNVIYTWRGGETTRHIPARYAAPAVAAAPPPLPSFGANSTFGSSFGNSAFNNNAFGSKPATPANGAGWSRQVVQTQTKVENPQPGVTRTTTTTKTRGASIGWNPPAAATPTNQGQLLSPARTERLFCELQLTADPQGVIQSVRIAQDTSGAGFSLSRCAEVLGVK
jgi:hypothetical protein